MVLGGRGGQGFCGGSSKALVIKSVSMGGWGIKLCPKLRDIIYGRPICISHNEWHVEQQRLNNNSTPHWLLPLWSQV